MSVLRRNPTQGHEDNFGFYDLTFPYEAEFMAHVRALSRPVKCDGCGHKVRLMPSRFVCATCAFNAEMGWGR
jgi:hypothetical protein